MFTYKPLTPSRRPNALISTSASSQPSSTAFRSTRNPSNPLNDLRQEVFQALEAWDEIFNSRNRPSGDSTREDTDSFLAELLQAVLANDQLSLQDWTAEEVCFFCSSVFPRAEFMRLIREGKTGKFFAKIKEEWKPCLEDWLFLLWRIARKAHELFSDVLYILITRDGTLLKEMGVVIFRALRKRERLHAETTASFVGALIERVRVDNMVVTHADQILKMSRGKEESLNATEVGMIANSVIRYRARKECRCGYGENDTVCECGGWRSKNPYGTPLPRGQDWVGDRDWVYALNLLWHVIKRFEASRSGWGDWKEFVVSACEGIFSRDAKEEMVSRLGEEVIHVECVWTSCGQNQKQGCSNASCGRCCKRKGVFNCSTHRAYNKVGLENAGSLRKNVTFS